MKTKVILIFLLSLFLISCGQEETTEYAKLNPEEAAEKMQMNEVVLLDVRTQEEFDAETILGSLLLPVQELELNALEILKDKEKIILVYCRSGNRSKTASNKLIELGYKNVYDIGGINDLRDNEYFADKLSTN